jgi:hypothetical protein
VDPSGQGSLAEPGDPARAPDGPPRPEHERAGRGVAGNGDVAEGIALEHEEVRRLPGRGRDGK